MIRIGVVNIDTSHPRAFSQFLLKEERARYAAVYNDGFRGDEEVDAFIKKCGLEKRCSSIEELADYVDIGFIQSCNWDNHLIQAMPFIRKNKPVFIDKPVVGSLADCRRLEELCEKGAVILGSSSLRYAQEIVDFHAMDGAERGEIVNIFCTSGVDDFNYCIHAVEAIGGLAGTGAVSVRFAGRASVDGKVCDTYLIRYDNGVTAVYNAFQGQWQPFVMAIMTTKSTFHFRIDDGKLYGGLLNRVCDYMETGINKMASASELVESVKIMLAGKVSRVNNGLEVRLSDIPADDPGFDGRAFEKEYAAAASRIYLE